MPFDPYKYGANGGYPFTEGNGWQYYWYVPHNVQDLVALTGGEEAFCKRLDEFFTSGETSGAKNDNASGFVGLYAHGNEPSHHVAYLYALAGQPAKTQQIVDHIKRTLYNTTSSGYAGNDDCGEMSAWYVFSALGFYPVNPASGEYVIGTPTVERAVLRLPGGRTFTVAARRKGGAEAVYVKSVRLNGQKLDGWTLKHADLMAGGTLEFDLGTRPKGRCWSSGEVARPPHREAAGCGRCLRVAAPRLALWPAVPCGARRRTLRQVLEYSPQSTIRNSARCLPSFR